MKGKELLKAMNNQNEYIDIEKCLYHYARKAYPILGYVMLLFASNAILFWGIDMANRKHSHSILYIVCQGMMLTGTVIYICFLLWWQKSERETPTFFLKAGVCYGIFLVVIGSCIAYMQVLENGRFHFYLYILVLTAVVIAFKPWQSVLLFFCSFFLINLILPHMFLLIGTSLDVLDAKKQQSFLYDGLFLAVMASVISCFLAVFRKKNYRNIIRMEEKNKLLCEMNDRLKKEVVVDKMTGLYNRRYLADHIQQKLKEEAADGLPVACMMVDVDYFKQYNDKYGHQKGDECLILVAQSVKKFFHKENVRVIRYGGEEFLIVLFDCTENEAMQQADKLRQEVENQRLVREDTPFGYLTVSIGVYAKQLDESLSFRQLIEKADTALYRAKAAGRNQVQLYSQSEL